MKRRSFIGLLSIGAAGTLLGLPKAQEGDGLLVVPSYDKSGGYEVLQHSGRMVVIKDRKLGLVKGEILYYEKTAQPYCLSTQFVERDFTFSDFERVM